MVDYAPVQKEARMKIVKEVDIAAPPETVYEYLLDFPRHAEWTTPGHDVSITRTSDGPTVVGSTFVSEAHQFGSQRDSIEVTELAPNRLVAYGVTMKDGNTFGHRFELEPTPAGTHLVKRFESRKLNLISTLTLPVGMVVAPKMIAHDMERIKAHVEQTATT
jgi:uncharacterized protein YndB with AHSA1/START domain